MAQPPPPTPGQPPPPRFPWFRSALLLGGLSAACIVYSRYHPELPWCRQVDDFTRPAVQQTCVAGAQAWQWAHTEWTDIADRAAAGRPSTAPATAPGAPAGIAGTVGTGPATVTPATAAPASPPAPVDPIDLFGGRRDPDLPPMSVYFTPTQSGSRYAVSRVLSSMILSARHSVIASYTDLNDQDLADALLEAHRTPGVTVEVGVDNRNCMRPPVQALIQAGIAVATDRAAGPVDCNFLVIDHQVVCFGSLTADYRGFYRDQNVLITIADRRLAQRFADFFPVIYPTPSTDLPAPATAPGACPPPAAPAAAPV
ncbi:MAG: phospholipase D-like domain-containing protein, partial [Planctomycetota bacterium]